MPTYIALLRAINVGGRNLISMTDLRELFCQLGFARVRTLLQSGNVVFESRRQSTALLEKRLETETEKRFKVSVDFVVRTVGEWKQIVEANPFVVEAVSDPARLIVFFLKSATTEKSAEDLRAAIRGRETAHGIGKQLYVIYPDGMGKSKFTNLVIERKLGTRGTARNWNSVTKLMALCQE